MEYRNDGLMVDYSGQSLKTTTELPPGGARSVVRDEKWESELETDNQETRLVRAMNELRPYTPSKTKWRAMAESQRDAFRIFRENVFRKHGLSPEQFSM
jgi:hypothetical protein